MSGSVRRPDFAGLLDPRAWAADEAVQHCAALTRAQAKNFYYAFLLVPRAEREAMFALYGFCRVADDIVDEPGTLDQKRRDLVALRGALDAAWAGEPRGAVLTALRAVQGRYPLSKQHLVAVIDGCEMDLEQRRYRTYEELAVYLDRVASAVGRATMEIFGIDPNARERYAVAGGQSVQLTNILRDVREDLERDRIYLPQEDLERFGVSEEGLAARRVDGPFRALMAFEVERARRLYHEARESLSEAERRRLLPLTAISRIYERVLDRIEAAGYDVFEQRASLPGWRKATLGLGTWLRARLHLRIGR